MDSGVNCLNPFYLLFIRNKILKKILNPSLLEKVRLA
jgi:hypothetical protein